MESESLICPRHGTEVRICDGKIVSISANCYWTHAVEVNDLVTKDQWYEILRREGSM